MSEHRDVFVRQITVIPRDKHCHTTRGREVAWLHLECVGRWMFVSAVNFFKRECWRATAPAQWRKTFESLLRVGIVSVSKTHETAILCSIGSLRLMLRGRRLDDHFVPEVLMDIGACMQSCNPASEVTTQEVGSNAPRVENDLFQQRQQQQQTYNPESMWTCKDRSLTFPEIHYDVRPFE